MGLLDSLKKVFSGPAPAAPAVTRPTPREIKVPEVMVAKLMSELRNGATPSLLDCRELYERRQGYIPGSMHIAMRDIPYRLHELDREADLVVYCAHGNRSYGVTGYLIENGFRASSLRGGIAGWQMQGGEIER